MQLTGPTFDQRLRRASRDYDSSQGTMSVIYDAIDMRNTTNFQFFEGARTFPFTNVQNNQLQAGYGIVVARIAFGVIRFADGAVSTVLPLFQAYPGAVLGKFSLGQQNSVAIQDMSIAGAAPWAGPNRQSNGTFIDLARPVTLQEQTKLQMTVQLPTITGPAAANTDYLAVFLIGPGALGTNQNQ